MPSAASPALDAVRGEFAKIRRDLDRSVVQLDGTQLHAVIAPDLNSVRVILKHLSGNLRSRFTDFLTTDGEKPDRDRDREFVEDPPDARTPRVDALADLHAAWAVLDAALRPLTDADLGRTVTIRGEPHTVAAALTRQLAHYGYHLGQVVLIAKTLKGSDWRYLTIPRGGSAAFNAAMLAARPTPAPVPTIPPCPAAPSPPSTQR